MKGADGKPIAQTADYSYNGYWVGDDNSVVIERAAGTTVFRMTNWGEGTYNVIFTINPDKKVTIEGKEYNVVTVSPQQVADNANYGAVYVSDCRRIKMASHMKPSPATGTESADSTSNSTITAARAVSTIPMNTSLRP